MIKVYEYRAYEPFEGLEVIDQQIGLMHKYQNKLVEIERVRRQRVREIQADDPAVLLLKDQIEALDLERKALREEIKATRKKHRDARTDQAKAARVKAIGVLLKPLFAAIKEAKAISRARARVMLAKVNQEAYADAKASRQVSGLYWGNYGAVDAAMDMARKMPLERYGEPNDPKFRRWEQGDGRVAVQIQSTKALSTTDVFGSDTRLRIVPFQRDYARTGRRAEIVDAHVWLRVGSVTRTQPIWAKARIVMHRPLPPGQIKWAFLRRRCIAGRFRWVLQIQVELTQAPSIETPTARCAVDVGWRLLANGDLRVAMLVDDHGRTEELRLPADLLAKDAHVCSLQAIRDRHLDAAKTLLLSTGLPLLDGLHVDKWRSPRRMVKFLTQHGDKLPAETRAKFDDWFERAGKPVSWSDQEQHLWTWQENERDKVQARRREIYRCWAASVAARYGLVVLEKFDLRPIARRATPEDGTATNSEEPRRLRGLASISSLRDILKNALTGRGGRTQEVSAVDSTRECHVCHAVDRDWDPARTLEHTCPGCGVEWDQDENAGHNLLARAPAPTPGEEDARDGQGAEIKQFSARQRRLRGLSDEGERRPSQDEEAA